MPDAPGSREQVEQLLDRIDTVDVHVNTVCTIHPDALGQAEALDEEAAEGRSRGPLHGVPVLVKDNIDTSDLPTTAGSLALADVRTGGFSGDVALQAGDFQTAATATGVATLSSPAADGDWSEATLNAAGLAGLNVAGVTQFRLYFTLDDDDDFANDFVAFRSGDDADVASRPQLVVTYR